MTAAPPCLSQKTFHSSPVQRGPFPVKNLARSHFDQKTLARRTFANLLWRAFPSSSEHELSHKAARVLDVSPRQVVNWLRCENDAGVSYVFATMLLAGAEIVFDRIEARR